ncbi:type II toxin-antitoxin system HicA family toxin [Candidatus Binatia bacterium]|nr:type II toxin-antitoxin system HicA family toxin [Candidatus Binatia bacterium]
MPDYSKLRSLTARQIIAALEKDGFTPARTRGSHRLYRHADGRRVTVSAHRLADTFPPGTLKSMIEVQARWTDNDLQRLGLVG